MTITDRNIEQYIEHNSSAEDPVLNDLNRKTHLDILQPRMLSGHIQGKVLEMISYMVKPRYVLEIGTYTGYSAICLAKGLAENGKVITIEINDELQDVISEYIDKAGFKGKIEPMVGNALQLIEKLDYAFDLVFIDADKVEYSAYYKAVLPKVKSGGFILADNVLWSGKVIDNAQANDPDTKAIIDFNSMVLQDPCVENVILPLRDGVNIIRKR